MNNYPLAIIAFGGNALIEDVNKNSISDQYQTIYNNVVYLVDLIEKGWRLVITHGNGPQVGFALRRSELSAHELSPISIDAAVANTQGVIGYMLQKALNNELTKRKLTNKVITLVTQALVSPQDPAFLHPDKPIGSFFSSQQAEYYTKHFGWSVMEDSGRGWRRCVASPKPLQIIELEIIQHLLSENTIVICCGGGGIPVIRNDKEELEGIEAVIDKDLTTALLAGELSADLLIIPTGVEQVAINFNTASQQWLSQMSVVEAENFCQQGEFPAGSMLPKIKSLISFLKVCPKAKGLITKASSIQKALEGKTGTWVISS